MGRMLLDKPELVREQVIETAQRLLSRGASVLTMNCGFGVPFQSDLVAATRATTVSSSLLLLPTLAAVHGGRVGVVTFDKTALSPAHIAAAGWPAGITPAVGDVQSFAEWRLLDEEGSIDLPVETMARQLLEVARALIGRHAVSALVLECSGMVPFAALLRRELDCEVYTIFDVLELVSGGRNST